MTKPHLHLWLLALLVFVSPSWGFAQTITRGPYLQSTLKTATILRWTTSAATSGSVKVGTSPGAETYSFADPSGTDHAVTISGLQPSTKYYYKIVSGAVPLAGGDASHYFVTSPDNGDEPFNAWALGDSGISSSLASGEHANQASVRDAFLNVVPLSDISLFLHLGDIAYYEGTDTQYQRGFFEIYPSILRTLATWPTQGNHDYTANAYYNVFSLPTNGEAGGVSSSTESYFSWDHGNAHFISLNSERLSPRSNMISWLNQDLAASQKTWTIVLFHHPPYSKGSHDSDNASDSGGRMEWMRTNILEILEDRGVDLVLSGHSHGYERSFFIDGHYGLSSTFNSSHKKSNGSGKDDLGEAYTKPSLAPLSNGGTVYVVAGSGGQLTTGVPLNHPSMYTSQAVLGSLHLGFNANELTVRFITNTGSVGDYFTIRKGTSLPRIPLSFDVSAANSNCAIAMTWTAAASATSYSIYRSDNRQSRGTAIAQGVNATSFTDTAPTPGVTYYYSIRGVNPQGDGPWSPVDSGVVPLSDRDGDGTTDCNDGCPDNASLTAPGLCGCGSEGDSDNDGTIDCNDACPNDPKSATSAPVCGCGKKPKGEFSDGRVNCSQDLSTSSAPTAPALTSSKGLLRVVMDSYSNNQAVREYKGMVLRGNKTIKRFASSRNRASVRLPKGDSVRVRYQITFLLGDRVMASRWSRFTSAVIK